ncbi:MAG: restriction endonuclease subunit S, partial [Defluviitaleaceae bacterium]|nr:restriction endonuclease subunit S [Defluviitaleaceae bacterium]
SIISLPQGVFLPYTGVKTNIIYATKINQNIKPSQKRKDFWYFDVKSDGYSLDNHRRKLESGSDLDKYQEYRQLDDNQRQKMLDAGFEIVPLDKVRENIYILVGRRYREQKMLDVAGFDLVSFDSVASVVRGVTYKKHDQVLYETDKIILPADNITLDGQLIVTKPIYLNSEFAISEEKKLRKNDIFICTSSGSKTHIGKVAFVNENTPYYAGGFMGIVRSKSDVCTPKYLYYYMLLSPVFREEIERLTQGASINNISSLVNIMKIPLPSLEMQQQIVDELDGYQRSIDDAKSVVEVFTKKMRNKINEIGGE